jgi:hypothetical protein
MGVRGEWPKRKKPRRFRARNKRSKKREHRKGSGLGFSKKD